MPKVIDHDKLISNYQSMAHHGLFDDAKFLGISYITLRNVLNKHNIKIVYAKSGRKTNQAKEILIQSRSMPKVEKTSLSKATLDYKSQLHFVADKIKERLRGCY